MRDKRPTSWHLLALLVTQVVLQACNSGLTVSPTAASPPAPPRLETTRDVRVTLFLGGTLDDGGTFDGYIVYTDRDVDSREGYGRFQGGLWELVVRGGSRTHDVRFASGTGGRALIEAYNNPYPAIGVIFLWPDHDPTVQVLSPHFTPRDGYDPEMQPKVADFGPLIPGSIAAGFGIFLDGQGGEARVNSLQLR